ncbi:hypothetical protein EYC84_003314 [Monilinia fructicola]|uniref:Uncharacterized protein n=1 Tax=Monilinia fructicola TaxID=38448 RepID=A0A5M9JXV1_MONFR|nr:hypothetical protein EYC84_003314 [Monilinia fructicola]
MIQKRQSISRNFFHTTTQEKTSIQKTIGNNMPRFKPQRPCCSVKIHRKTIRRLNYYWRSHILATAVSNGKSPYHHILSYRLN